MYKKFSIDNVVRAVDFIAKYGTNAWSRAEKNIRIAKSKVRDRFDRCEKIKMIVGSGDRLISQASRCGLNTDIIYRVFLKDAKRYALQQAKRIKFYELVMDLVGNYCECRAHMVCSTVPQRETLPAFHKDYEDGTKWYVLPGAWKTDNPEARTLSTAFYRDSRGKVHDDYMTYASSLANRTPSPAWWSEFLGTLYRSPKKMQVMVYTGKFTRMYPIVLMLTMELDNLGKFSLPGPHNYNCPVRIPKDWIPIMCRIPRKPGKNPLENTQPQGETR